MKSSNDRESISRFSRYHCVTESVLWGLEFVLGILHGILSMESDLELEIRATISPEFDPDPSQYEETVK